MSEYQSTIVPDSSCLGLADENIYSVFRSLHLPVDTQFWTRGFPLVMRSRRPGLRLAPRACKREPYPLRYVSRMTRPENFLSQNFFIVFWKPLFSTFHATLFIVSRMTFRFLKSAPTTRYTTLDSRLSPCYAISEDMPALSKTSSEEGALPLEVRIENDSDRKNLSQSFSGNHFYPKKIWSPHLVKNF